MSKPLQGLRVIELGQLLAGPFAGCMLGYFGAEVIKVEPPGGDPIRNWREVKDGTSLWWRSLGRNKKCISLDLKTEAGIGDTVSGLHAVIGILMALRSRDEATKEGKSGGQVVDVALYESMFNLLEAVIPEYDGAGVIRQPSGTTVTGIVPTNTYKCADGKFLVIGGNGDSIFARLMTAVGRADMASDAKYETNADRVVHEAELDEVLADWCDSYPLTEAMAILEDHRVPCGPVYNAADMVEDEHFKYRELFETVEINGEPLKIPAIMPKLQGTPGGTEWPGPDVGSHTNEILQSLGLDDASISQLKLSGVVSDA